MDNNFRTDAGGLPDVTRVAVYAMSPLHLIGQFAALCMRYPGENPEVHLILHWPHAANALQNELADVMRTMTSSFRSISRVTVVSQDDVDGIMLGASATERYERFSGFLNAGSFDEIYYPHDVGGFIFQLLSGSNPDAIRITTGENLGHVFERDVYFSYFNPESQRPRLRVSLRSLMKTFFSKGKVASDPAPLVPDYRPHLAILAMPIDQSGKYLSGLDLIVPPRQLVQEIARECASNCRRLQDYVGSLMTSPDQRRYVLCTQNFFECGTIDKDNDVGMWCDIIRSSCEPSSTVLIKTHPAETMSRAAGIAASLGSEYKIIELDKTFSRYPIELWSEFVKNTVVITGSTPMLTLKYLYDVDCIQPFSDSLIEKWFPQPVWRFYKNGLSLNTLPLARFPAWNNSGVLWAGGKV